MGDRLLSVVSPEYSDLSCWKITEERYQKKAIHDWMLTYECLVNEREVPEMLYWRELAVIIKCMNLRRTKI